MLRVVKQRNRLPREAVDSPCLEVLKIQLDMALGSPLCLTLLWVGCWTTLSPEVSSHLSQSGIVWFSNSVQFSSPRESSPKLCNILDVLMHNIIKIVNILCHQATDAKLENKKLGGGVIFLACGKCMDFYILMCLCFLFTQMFIVLFLTPCCQLVLF